MTRSSEFLYARGRSVGLSVGRTLLSISDGFVNSEVYNAEFYFTHHKGK